MVGYVHILFMCTGIGPKYYKAMYSVVQCKYVQETLNNNTTDHHCHSQITWKFKQK